MTPEQRMTSNTPRNNSRCRRNIALERLQKNPRAAALPPNLSAYSRMRMRQPYLTEAGTHDLLRATTQPRDGKEAAGAGCEAPG
jgi:hypothetical protein